MKTLNEVFESGGDIYEEYQGGRKETVRSYPKPQLAAFGAEVARECLNILQDPRITLPASRIEKFRQQLENEV